MPSGSQQQAGTSRQKPLVDAYSPKWDHQQKLIITIAALCASLSSPRRFVDAHVSRDLFDYDLDATPLEERAPDLAKKLEQIDLAYESDESEHLDKPVDKTSSPKTDRTGMLSNEDEAAVAAEMKQVEKEELTETARERARRNRAQRWLKAICRSFDVDFRSLPPDPRVGEARVLGEEIPASMYHEILHDLILFSLSVDDSDGSAPANSDQAKKVRQGEAEEAKQAQSAITFSALDRKLVFVTADILGITREQVYLSEKVVAQELFFVMRDLEDQKRNSTTAASMNDTSQSSIAAAASRSKMLRWAGAGVGVVLGGAAIGLTGGLAAPLLAPLLVGASGGALAFLGTSGGAVLLGTLFGIGGGGLAGYRAQRRLKGVEEFEFVRVPLRGEEEEKDDDEETGIPKIPSLHATICVSGFLLKQTDYIDTWTPTFSRTPDRRDVFALKLETGAMLSAGQSLDHYVRNYLITKGATEVVKRTALAAFYSAVALPAVVYKSAALALDNDFQRTRDRAEKGGLLLADVLEKGVQGARPVILVGSSLGAVTIFRCLLELHSRNLVDLVDHVILISAPLSPSPSEWAAARHVVSRGFYNVYSTNDWVLSIVCRLHSLVSTRFTLKVAGLQNPGIEGVTAIDVSDILSGHLEIGPKMDQILGRVGICR